MNDKGENEELITVKELSNRLKVSHTTIYNLIKEIERETDPKTYKEYIKTIKNVKHITSAGQKAIYNAFIGKEEEEKEQEEQEVNPAIITELLEDQISFLKEQINRKDHLIKEQSDTIKELSERMKELNYIKALEQKEEEPKKQHPSKNEENQPERTEKKGFIRYIMQYFKGNR